MTKSQAKVPKPAPRKPRFDWGKVPADTFEEIVGALLQALGYTNVVRRGAGGGAWDLDAQWIVQLPSGDQSVQNWRIECKKHKRSPDPKLIRDHASRMLTMGSAPDHILFVATSSLSHDIRTSIEQHAATLRVGCSFWDRQKLDDLLDSHLDDPRLARLLSPYMDLDLPADLLAEACRHQVAVEIQQRVGRKFIPDLCRARPLEDQVAAFLAADLSRQQVADFLASVRRLQPPRQGQEAWQEALAEVSAAQNWNEAQPPVAKLLQIAGSRRLAVVQAVDAARLRRACFLIRDRAGSGKTNLLCRLAYVDPPPGSLFLFFSCKMDLPPSRRLDEVIASALGAALAHVGWSGGENDPLALSRMLELALRRGGHQLVILLDGINENRDLRALDQAITDLLLRWNPLPIKFLVTCRDIFWSFFDARLWAPFLWAGKAHDLPGFGDDEMPEVLDAYFRAFEIRGRVSGAAREKCRHPLILRFFCEAHRARDVRDFQDLRLKDLFAEYWLRKKDEIAESLDLGRDGGLRVEMFLASLVDHLMKRQATQLLLGEMPQVTGEGDLDSDRSIYRRLLDQDIILEELPPVTAIDQSLLARRVGFVYDEFFDYMMALGFARSHGWDAKKPAAICQDFVLLLESSAEFEQIRGVAEYLVLFGEPSSLHSPLCATLAHLAQYEILCNVLPKLRDDGAWIEAVLLRCLIAAEEQEAASRVKRATGWKSLPAAVAERLAGLVEADLDTLLSTLLGERELAGDYRLKVQEHPDEPALGPTDARFSDLLTGADFGTTPFSLFDEWHTLVDGYVHNVYKGIYRTIDFSQYLSPREPTLGSQSICRTVWTLWQSRPERVWALIETWSRGGTWRSGSDRVHFPDVFLEFGQTLFKIGITENHLEPQPILDRLRDWLGENKELRNLSSRILPSFLARMESVEVAKIVDEWADDRRTRALGDALARLFQLKPKTFLSLMGRWVRAATPQMDTLLTACFEQLEVPELGKARDYHQLEVALRNVRLQLGGSRPPALRTALDRFVRRLHKRMSVKAGEDARSQEGPSRSGPTPRSRSGKPRAHPRRST